MARELNFNALSDVPADEETQPTGRASAGATSWRRRREVNPTVQMSVRMREDVYEQFRMLCQTERRTNGHMLEIMMEVYKRSLDKPR